MDWILKLKNTVAGIKSSQQVEFGFGTWVRQESTVSESSFSILLTKKCTSVTESDP